jgi:hypothetical protein
VADERKKRFEAADEVAANDLNVIKVELDAQVHRADYADDVGRMLDAIEKIARTVARIERLDQKRDAGQRRLLRCSRKIPDEDRLRRRPLFRRDATGKAMDGAAADRDDIVYRELERVLPFALAAGHGGKSGFTLPTERRVDAELHQTMPLQLGLHSEWRHVVGILQLDRAEACRSRRAKALDQRTFGEQKGEVGGEAGHAAFSRKASRTLFWGDIPLQLQLGHCPLYCPL